MKVTLAIVHEKEQPFTVDEVEAVRDLGIEVNTELQQSHLARVFARPVVEEAMSR